MTEHKMRYTYSEYLKLLAEFEDLLYSDPQFNYGYGEFDKWVAEVVQSNECKHENFEDNLDGHKCLDCGLEV